MGHDLDGSIRPAALAGRPPHRLPGFWLRLQPFDGRAEALAIEAFLIEVPCRRALRRALSVASDSAGLEIKPPLAVPLQTPRAPELPGTPAH